MFFFYINVHTNISVNILLEFSVTASSDQASLPVINEDAQEWTDVRPVRYHLLLTAGYLNVSLCGLYDYEPYTIGCCRGAVTPRVEPKPIGKYIVIISSCSKEYAVWRLTPAMIDVRNRITAI